MRSLIAITGLLTGALAVSETVLSPAVEVQKPSCEVIISAKYEKSKHHKKAIGYISFDNNDASLVSSREKASNFTSSQDGFLMSNESYVGAVSGTGFAVLERSAQEPLFPTFWDVSINSELSYKNEAFTFGQGKAVFCVAQDNVIFSLYTSSPPFTCKELSLTAEYRDAECTPVSVDDDEAEEVEESGLELRSEKSLEARHYVHKKPKHHVKHWKPKHHRKPKHHVKVHPKGHGKGSYNECGFRNGQCCAEGLCCSQYGYCGKTAAYCGKGCLSAFGTCGVKSHPKPAHPKPHHQTKPTKPHHPAPHYPSHPKPSHPEPPHYPTHPKPSHPKPEHPIYPSHGGSYNKCGFRNGQKCATGLCCSQYGYCGKTQAYCGKGCLRMFGKCAPKYPHPTPTHPPHPDPSSDVDLEYEHRNHEEKRNIVDEA